MVIFCKIRNSTIESLSSAQDLLPLTLAYCTVYSTVYFKAKIVGGLWSLWLSKAIIHSLLIIHSDFGLPCILRCLKLRHHICWGVDNIQDERWAERLLTLHICYACMQHKAQKNRLLSISIKAQTRLVTRSFLLSEAHLNLHPISHHLLRSEKFNCETIWKTPEWQYARNGWPWPRVPHSTPAVSDN